MKRLIRWLYRRFVFMPELCAHQHPKDRYRYLVEHDIDLLNDADILREMISYEDDPSPKLRIVGK